MSTSRLLLMLAAGALTLTAAGCGEQKVIVYKQGQYQGKPDTAPWDNDAFKGSQVEWEKAIKARNLGQNEYARSTPTAN